MFTGIVAAVGDIIEVSPQKEGTAAAGVRLRIRTNDFSLDGIGLGDSIAIQGACMTVVAMAGDYFDVDVSRESLACTAGLDATGPVNLERSLKVGDTLDGHLVSGHVDGLGTVALFEPIGESWDLRIDVPAELSRYLAKKGSITVNGVSLTVNRVDDHAAGCLIYINLIPHTVNVTTLKHLAAGMPVNLEIDMIARYVERMLGRGYVQR